MLLFHIKTIIRNTLLLALTIMNVGLSYGQNSTNKVKGIKKAEKRFDELAFVDARDLYTRIADKGIASPEVYKKLGDSYYFTGEYSNAVTWYSKLINSTEYTVEPEDYFRYAQSLKSVQKYEEADVVMDTFEKINGTDTRSQMFVKERNYLEEIERQSGRYSIRGININSSLQDFSPSFYGERLVFSSNRETRTGDLIHDWNDQPFLDLYIVDNPESDTPIIRQLNGEANTKYHESSSAFNSRGDIMYFTRSNYTDKKLKRDESGVSKHLIFCFGYGWFNGSLRYLECIY